MSRHPAVRHIQTAHSQAKTWLPLASALITLLGFFLTLTDDQVPPEGSATPSGEADEGGVTPIPRIRPAPLYRPLVGTLLHLTGALVRVLGGTLAVGALVWGYTATDAVGRAVLLTLLGCGVIWLASLRQSYGER